MPARMYILECAALTRPYVLSHVIPGLFPSATSIFSAGSAFRWVRDQLCRDLAGGPEDPYDLMTALEAGSPVGPTIEIVTSYQPWPSF
jgi:hypothetical protein